MGWECEGTTAFLREGIGQDCAGSAAPLSPIRPKASGPEVSGVDTAARVGSGVVRRDKTIVSLAHWRERQFVVTRRRTLPLFKTPLLAGIFSSRSPAETGPQ